MRISHPSRRDLLKLGALGLGSAVLPLTRLRLGLADNGSESSPSPIDPPFTHSLTPEGVPPVLARVPGGPPPGAIIGVDDPRLANPDATASPFRIRRAGGNTDFYEITKVKKVVRIPGVAYPAGVPGTEVWAYVAPGHPQGVLLGPTIKSEAITSFLQGVTARDEDPRISFDPLQRPASARPAYGRPAAVDRSLAIVRPQAHQAARQPPRAGTSTRLRTGGCRTAASGPRPSPRSRAARCPAGSGSSRSGSGARSRG